VSLELKSAISIEAYFTVGIDRDYEAHGTYGKARGAV
jgi:hypothetical protein